MPGGQLAQQLHGPALAAQLGPRRSPRPGPAAAAWPACRATRRSPGPAPLELEVAQLGHVALHGPDRGRGRRWPPGPGSWGWRRPAPGSWAWPPWPAGRRRRRVPAGGEHQPADGQPDHQQQDQRRRQPPTRRPRGGSGRWRGRRAPPPAPPASRRRGAPPRRAPAASAAAGARRRPGRARPGVPSPGVVGCQPGPPGGGWGHDAGSPARDSTSSWVRRRNERRGRSRSSTATSRRELPVSPAGAAWRRTRMASCRAASSSMSSS